LRSDLESKRLCAVIQLMRHRFEEAWQLYSAASDRQKIPPPP
jgi:hypothetical protein